MAEKEQSREVSEHQARQVAERSRQKTEGRSFLRQVFLGNFPFDELHPYPDFRTEREGFVEFYSKLEDLIANHTDSGEVDRGGKYPEPLVRELKKLGAFGMKIPEEYDGLGFSQLEYDKALEMVGRYDSNLVALLSAHQSIGVPQPLKLFGTEAQKKKYLPKVATDWISAFALTEPDVGSDPARLTSSYRVTPEGDFVLNGHKLWCTNGTFGDVYVVMARHEDSGDISAFIVEADWEGVDTPQRCHFMGLRALENGVVTLDEVRVPAENLIGEEGAGLKIALVTLNTGRLSLPAAAVGVSKRALEICRQWCNDRVQWGQSIGKHEAVGHMLADIACKTWAMESIADLCGRLAERIDDGYDIRLAAAAAKEFNSERGWEVVDDMIQIRGGRGYETEHSLRTRGEEPVECERMMRDFRINRIFEGSTEIMHLFMAREAVDKHLEVAGALVEPDSTMGEVLKALPSIVFFYAWWYTSRWLPTAWWPKYNDFGPLAGHLRFAERASARLARNIFHGMALYRARLEKKQAFLARAVKIGIEIFAIASTCSRAKHLADRDAPNAETARKLTDLYCREATLRIRRLFREMWTNNDEFKYGVARDILDGQYRWLEEHTVESDEDVASEYEPGFHVVPPPEQAAE